MAFDVEGTAKEMIGVAAAKLGPKWSEVRALAEPEFKKIAMTIATIEAGRLSGTITAEQARLLLEMQKNASRAVLLAVEVIGLLAAEDIIQGALAIVGGVVNKAVGMTLIA